MCWSFAIINGKLAEVYFDNKKDGPKFLGHCYVKRSDYTQKSELKQINHDIKTIKLRYYGKKYTNLQGVTS